MGKLLIHLAISNESTFLSASEESVRDMSGNKLDPIPPEMGLMVTLFTPDTTPPELEDFTLDLTQEVVCLTFDETVNASCFDPSQISFQTAEWREFSVI